MFTLLGQPSRREFLRIGGLTALGLTLPRMLHASTASRPRARNCILIFMEGGPSHIDLFDKKPHAPEEVRGELRPIATSVPGTNIAETLPRLGQHMHRIAQVRSVAHTVNDHNAGAYYMLTGKYPVDGARLIIADAPGNFPPYGSVLSKLRPTPGSMPSYIQVPQVMSNNSVNIAGQSAGFLGGAYDPLVVGDPSLPDWQVPGMVPAEDVTPSRLSERNDLVRRFDRFLGNLADDRALRRMDRFHQRAVEMVASRAVRDAFDLSREPESVRERYGFDRAADRLREARQFGGLPHLGQSMLLARRLIEADVRLVTVITGRRYCQAWDTHRDHFGLLRQSLCPMFDRATSALLEDLAIRGLLDETLVVIMGEFGRTPRLGFVTSGAGAAANGRDHWPFCYTVMFAGAGVPGGAIIGSSDRTAAYPSLDPYRPEDVAATIYNALGIPLDTEIRDTLDRPHTLATGRPIRGLS